MYVYIQGGQRFFYQFRQEGKIRPTRLNSYKYIGTLQKFPFVNHMLLCLGYNKPDVENGKVMYYSCVLTTILLWYCLSTLQLVGQLLWYL